MTGATHMVTAAAVYSLIQADKPVALLLAFASHFALDAIPHYEPGRTWNYILGAVTGLYLLFAAWMNRDIFILAAAFLGALPDLNWMLGGSKSLDRMHRFLHSKHCARMPSYVLLAEILATSLIIMLL